MEVEVAQKPEERKLGLKYRKSLKENSGMLFVFGEEGNHSFTMKNTYIPLDIIFIDSSKTIKGIIKNASPMTDGPYSIETESLYVLEVNALFCDKNAVRTGSKIILKNF